MLKKLQCILYFKSISLNIDSLDPEIVDKEKQVLIEQAISSGKPKEIAEKMVEARMVLGKKLFY